MSALLYFAPLAGLSLLGIVAVVCNGTRGARGEADEESISGTR